VKKFGIIGGDKRNIFLRELLEDDFNKVEVFNNNLDAVVKNSDVIIAGTPFTTEEDFLFFPLTDTKIKAHELIDLLREEQILIAGSINAGLMSYAKETGKNVVDLLNNECFALQSAVPTAEGAIKIAIEKTDYTLSTSTVMVIGFGRIGSVLAKMLQGMGAKVFVVVNNIVDFAKAQSLGHKAVMHKDINDYLLKTDIVMNTATNDVLTEKNFFYIDKDALVIDLSSPPFGIDTRLNGLYGIQVIWARALPGKIAPRSVAYYMRDVIYEIVGG